MNTSSKFLSGLIVGAVAGLATGLLIAPSSGNSTRKTIMNKSRVYSQQAIDAVRQYLDGLKAGYVRKAEEGRASVDTMREIY